MRRPVLNLLLVLASSLVTLPLAAQPVLKGRLVNGTQMLKTGGMSALGDAGFNPEAERIPLAETVFDLRIVDGVHAGKLWRGQTDAEGRFEIQLAGLDQLPTEPALVASVARTVPLHSMRVAVNSGAENEFRLYEVSEDSKFLPRSGLETLYILRENAAGEKDIEVHVNLLVSNFAGTMYVGKSFATPSGKNYRAVMRIPLPAGATVSKNEAFQVHDRQSTPAWTITPDGWAILDSPLAPLTEAPSGAYYSLVYRVPASQEQAFAYPVDLPLEEATAWAIHQDMDLQSPQLTSKFTQKRADPSDPGGEQLTWTLLGTKNAPESSTLGVAVIIDSMVLREINSSALKVVLGLVLGCLFALLLGLVFGSRAPQVEKLLAEATGEEIIQRIAQLDLQHERGKVSEKEYLDTRQRLLALARLEVAEVAEVAEPGATPAPAAPATVEAEPHLPDRVVELVSRIRELEGEGSNDPTRLQERLLLLEDLARAVEEHSSSRS